MSPAIAGAASPTGPREAELSARGMTCACRTALAGKKLSGLDYVPAAVNSAAGRATVSVSAPVPAARLIEAAERAGYGADPWAGAAAGRAAGAGADAARGACLRRLIVALVSVGPLSDLSVVLPLFPWPGFRGWQRVLPTAGGTGPREEGLPCPG
jgi:hypothetical protein